MKSRLAVGAAYGSHAPASLPENPPEFFALRAKTYLDIEMDSPIVATIQALMILSSHEAAQMRDSRGEIVLPRVIYSQLTLRRLDVCG